MTEVDDIVDRNARAFSGLRFDENATRHYHIQGCGFYWSDELPHKHGQSDLERDYHRLIIFLVSYRSHIIFEHTSPELDRYTPLWTAFKKRCNAWPGFHESRTSPALAEALVAAGDRSLHDLERFFRICERTKNRRRKE
jgi:hypothetical protein